VRTTSHVGRIWPSTRWPPCAVPSFLPITACAWTAGLPSFNATSPTRERSSTCSSSVTDGSYFLLSQLNQARRTELRAPTALKLAADSFCSSANFDKPFASSSPVWNTRTNVFGDWSICLKFMVSSLKEKAQPLSCGLLMKSKLWERNNWTMVSTILWYWLALRVVFSRAALTVGGDGDVVKSLASQEVWPQELSQNKGSFQSDTLMAEASVMSRPVRPMSQFSISPSKVRECFCCALRSTESPVRRFQRLPQPMSSRKPILRCKSKGWRFARPT
jgi:hypothetical protein